MYIERERESIQKGKMWRIKVKRKGDEGNIVNKILEMCRERKRVERSKKRIMDERESKKKSDLYSDGCWNLESFNSLPFFLFFFTIFDPFILSS